MAIIKSHVCNMCGGLLDIDLDRQMYICPFCGVTFDYEYFREDNVLEIANKALNRCEFGSAKDAFDFILQKDPHDFQALRGLILCRCKWKNLLPMQTYNQVHLREDDPYLVSAIENCHPEKKEYFEKIRDAVALLKEFRHKRTELQKLEDSKSASEQQLDRLRLAKSINHHRFTMTVSDFFDDLCSEYPKAAELVVIIALIILFGIGYATWALGWMVLAIIVTLAAITIVVYNVNKSIKNKALDAAMVPLTEMIEKLNDEIKENRTESSKMLFRYETMAKEIVKNEARTVGGNKSEESDEDEEE